MVEPSKTERKEEGKAWEAAEMAEGRDSSQVATPADRAVSHTQVMAGQPSLAIVPQLTFHNDVLEHGHKFVTCCSPKSFGMV